MSIVVIEHGTTPTRCGVLERLESGELYLYVTSPCCGAEFATGSRFDWKWVCLECEGVIAECVRELRSTENVEEWEIAWEADDSAAAAKWVETWTGLEDVEVSIDAGGSD